MSSSETLGWLGQAEMMSETSCSYVNDRISIDFSAGKWRTKTFQRDHPGVDLNIQQYYIYKPSELFEKAADSFVMDGSRGQDNLACSYELFDEIDEFDDFDNGYFKTSDSFACTFDPKLLKDGLLEFNDSISFYSSRMPLDYETVRSYTEGSFHHNFSVADNPGTYCVNVTTYKTFDKPIIKYWDQTPVSGKFPQLSLPVYDYICWIVIASGFLVFFAACDAIWNFNILVSSFVAVCLCKNVFDLLSVYFDSREDMLVLQILVTGILGTILTVAPLMIVIIFSFVEDEALQILIALISLMEVFNLMHLRISRFFQFPRSGYFVLGSLMNDLVLFKDDGEPNLYATFSFKMLTVLIFIIVLIVEQDFHSKRKALIMIFGLVMFYLFICFLIEKSFFTRKSQFVDVFYKDFTVIVYSRLDGILIIAYICGNALWKTFCKHYQCYKSKFTTVTAQ